MFKLVLLIFQVLRVDFFLGRLRVHLLLLLHRDIVLFVVAPVVPQLLVVRLRFGLALFFLHSLGFLRILLGLGLGHVDFDRDILVEVGCTVVLDLMFDPALDVFQIVGLDRWGNFALLSRMCLLISCLSLRLGMNLLRWMSMPWRRMLDENSAALLDEILIVADVLVFFVNGGPCGLVVDLGWHAVVPRVVKAVTLVVAVVADINDML